MSYDNGTAFPHHPDLDSSEGPPVDQQFNRQGGQQSQHNGGGNYNQQQKPWNNGQQKSWGNNQGGQKSWNNGGQNRGGFQGNRGGGGGNWGGGNKFGGNRSNEPLDLTLYKPYAVSGNPNPPPDVTAKIEAAVRKLEGMEYTLRTGGVSGVEEAAEKVATKLELLLPWRGFADKESKLTFNDDRAKSVAKKFSPTFDSLKPSAQGFLCKNARLLLGQRVNSPALFLLVWTEDGAETSKERTLKTGFAGHIIAIANSLGIHVFNFGKLDAEQRLNSYLEGVVNDGSQQGRQEQGQQGQQYQSQQPQQQQQQSNNW